tara:strand:+ start:213 stop:425 length:213 start_codon:yes stop_codon:yes gene_type:complete
MTVNIGDILSLTSPLLPYRGNFRITNIIQGQNGMFAMTISTPGKYTSRWTIPSMTLEKAFSLGIHVVRVV